jgi:hypothetical protein
MAELRGFMPKLNNSRIVRDEYDILKSMSGKPRRLSKSRFISGLQCRKRLYLEVHHRELMSEPTPGLEKIFASGTRVGELARDQFPGGVLIDNPYYDIKAALKETSSAMEKGVQILFEPAFIYENVLVRVDVLRKNEQGTWDIIEVKSTTSISDTHLTDIAVQRYVVEGSGLSVGGCYHMHLNRECYYPRLENLFEISPVDEGVAGFKDLIEEKVQELNILIQQDSVPEIPIGTHCNSPYACQFIEHCWKDVIQPSIFTIPRLNAKKVAQLIEMGITGVVDIPDSFKLSENQHRYVNLLREGRKQILWTPIREMITRLQYPLYFLDFETQADPVPRLEYLGPYHQYPFQYSLHIQSSDGTVEHREYLHPDTSDPRLPLAKSLLEDIGEVGTIIAYNAPFEKRVISELTRQVPKYASRLRRFKDRFFDLLVIFREFYIDPAFGGSNSIKKVLPVLVPALSYASLEVQSGDIAQVAWLEMISTESNERRIGLANSLKAYCKLDTLSMVRILEYLLNEIALLEGET